MPTGPGRFDLRHAPEVLAEFHRARVVRRRWFFGTLAVVVLAGVGFTRVAWRHFFASSWLEANGIRADWQVDAATWRVGGVTTVRARALAVLAPKSSQDTELTALGDLHRVEELDLSAWPGLRDDDLAVLEKLTELRLLNLDQKREPYHLTLGRAGLTDATLARLGRLRHLRDLSIAGARITDSGLAHLAGLDDLESLDLGRTEITDAGLEPLKRLKGLKSLVLDGTRVTPRAVQAFEAARPAVRVLDDRSPPPPGPR